MFNYFNDYNINFKIKVSKTQTKINSISFKNSNLLDIDIKYIKDSNKIYEENFKFEFSKEDKHYKYYKEEICNFIPYIWFPSENLTKDPKKYLYIFGHNDPLIFNEYKKAFYNLENNGYIDSVFIEKHSFMIDKIIDIIEINEKERKEIEKEEIFLYPLYYFEEIKREIDLIKI